MTANLTPIHPAAAPAEKPAIVFDFGGVLIGWDPYYLYRKLFANDEQIEEFLKEIDFFEWNLQQDAGRAFSEAVAELCARFPHRGEMIRAYDARYEESLSAPIEGTVNILRSLKDAGYPLFGLTNWSNEKFPAVRRKYSFFECFDDIVVSGAVRLLKPDPRIFHILLERIGRPAQECILIDDSAPNIEAANAIGFQTILFEGPDQLARSLKQRLNGKA